MRETQVDGDTAALFFGEPVAVNPGKSFHERRLAVVDMARRTDDNVSHAAVFIVLGSHA